MKKKLLFISHSSAFSGGAEDDFVSMLSYFGTRKSDYEIDAMFPKGPKAEVYSAFCERSGYLMWGHLPVVYQNAWRYAKYCAKFLIQFVQIFKFTRRRDYDLCIINVAVLIWPILILKLLGFRQLVLVKESIEPYFMRKQIYKLISHCAAYVVPNSMIMQNDYTRITNKTNISTVYSAVKEDSGPGLPMNELEVIIKPDIMNRLLDRNIFKIFCIGNIIEIKNQLLLIKAFSILQQSSAASQIELFLVGDTDKEMKYTKRIRKYAAEKSISNKVHFLGRLDKECTKTMYEFMDSLFITSLSEGIPLVLVYALKYKKPIISTNAGGIGDVIKNGYNGFLVEYSEEDIANAMIKLYSEKDKLKLILDNGFMTYAEKFNWAKNMEQLESIVCSICNNGHITKKVI